MQAVILAGGLGTRISEESVFKPKPMIEIGGKPILWHIMKIYSSHGISDFIICCGYKGYVIKEYFANYFMHNSDVTFDLKKNSVEVHQNSSEPWRVTIVDTGENTMTGGRLKRVKEYIQDDTFCFTYGDGLSNVNISQSIEVHKKNKTLATVTAVQPPGRFGQIKIKDNLAVDFVEKPDGENGFINGGFFILEKKAINYIDNDLTVWERAPLEKLAADKQLSVYMHRDFWQPMDTLRDKNLLEELWANREAPWKVW